MQTADIHLPTVSISISQLNEFQLILCHHHFLIHTVQDPSLEVASDQSLCFRSSFYTASTPSQPLSDPTAACYKVHPFFDGTNHRYAVETAADGVTTIFDGKSHVLVLCA